MPGAGYSASGSNTLAATADSALSIISDATTAHRCFISEFIIGFEGTPADNNSDVICQRCTAEGTATGVTPTKLDPADRAAQANVGENHTVEPTYTANEELLEYPLNHRATFRWVASPGQEIVTPATANNGVGWYAGHASATVDYRVTALWKE